MENVAMETIYFWALIVCLSLTFLVLVFSDLMDISSNGTVLFDPAIILIFLSIVTGGGYLLEKFTSLSSVVILLIASVISFIITALIYLFLLVPIRSAEVSLVYTDQSLEGQLATVITPIPIDGYGEILLNTVNGAIHKRATSFRNEEIPQNETCLIIEMKENTAYVVKYEQPFEGEIG